MKKEYVKMLQNCGKRFFITATGGGTSFLGEFLKIPGGSKCIVGGYIPYANEATDNFIGSSLEKYADAYAARRLAVASFEKCESLHINNNHIGVGIACSLIKDNERIGREHHINIAIHTKEKTFGVSVVFRKSKLSRSKEEDFVNDLTLFMLVKSFCDPKMISREWEVIHQMIYLDNDADVSEFEAHSPMKSGNDIYVHSVLNNVTKI